MLDNIVRSLRGKAVRVVEDAVGPYHRDQAIHIAELHQQIAGLREQLTGETRVQTDRVLESVGHMEHRARRDLSYAGEAEAALQSARFVRECLTAARHFASPHETLEHALSLAPTEGMALEFGVYTGTTLKIITAARSGAVFGFDSFEGLPDDWRAGFPAGTFNDLPGQPRVAGSELVVGWFDEVLPKFLQEHPGTVAFLHVDCDLYSSTKTVLDLVGPRLQPGSIVVFDEYFNYPGWQEHEYKAWAEYVESSGLRFDYVGYTIDHEQVIVKVVGK